MKWVWGNGKFDLNCQEGNEPARRRDYAVLAIFVFGGMKNAYG